MLRRPDRTTSIFFLFILANAASLFFFRFFLTLDGPMHLLHAYVLKAEWFSHRYNTPELYYAVNRGTLDLTDLILVPLVTILGPLDAHTAYAAIVLVLLGSGLLSVAKAVGVRSAAAFMWVLPLSCSFIFIMGFFTFLAATGLALWCLSWWMRRTRITWCSLIVLVAFLLACQATHRAGAVLALLLVGSYEAAGFGRDRSSWSTRWSGIPRAARNIGFFIGGAGMMWKVLEVMVRTPLVHVHGDPDPFGELLHLRPLVLFDSWKERGYLLGLGILLIASLLNAFRHRARDHAGSPGADALLLSATLLLLSSFAMRTPNAQLLYMSVRAQTVALLLLAVWLSVTSPAGRTSWVLGFAVVCTHTARTIHFEKVLAGIRPLYEASMQVVERLPPHGVSLPVVRDHEWMQEHLSAFVAASYQGVFFSSGDHMAFRHKRSATDTSSEYSFGYPPHLRWLNDHVASNTAPVIDHVVMFGHGGPPDERIRNISAVLDKYYFLQWQNDYAEVWARDTAP